MSRNLASALVKAALLLAVLPLMSTASARQDAAPPPQQGQVQTQRPPMPKPTNLQVLPKDIAVPDLMATMRGFAKGLGVECGFCHVIDQQTHQPNFASDAKPEKATARIMITMTQQINAKYLAQVNDPDATPADKTVTCGTCHRGSSMPPPFNPAAGSGESHEQPPAQKPQ